MDNSGGPSLMLLNMILFSGSSISNDWLLLSSKFINQNLQHVRSPIFINLHSPGFVQQSGNGWRKWQYIIPSMLTNYNQVTKLISMMNTPQVSQAEAELVQLAKVDTQVLPCLHDLLKDSSQQGWVHTIAASFINRLICDEQVGMETEQASRLVLEILMDLEIDPVYKRGLERSIVYIIDSLDQPHLTAFRENVYPMMNDERLRDTVYLFVACWAIPKIDVLHVTYLYNVALRQTLNRFVDVGSNQIMMAAEYNEIIKTWAVTWQALRRSEEEAADKIMYQILDDERFPLIISFIYEWMAVSPLYICTSDELNELNILKNEVAELHLLFLEKSVEFRKKYSTNTAVFAASEKMMLRIMQNLQRVSSEREQLDQFMCKDLVITFMKILREFLCASPESFTNLWKEIFTHIVIPYITIDSDEIEQFQDFPDQFIALQEDCAEKQTFGILKTQACKLLERMSDKSQKIIQDQFIPNFVLKVAFNSFLASMGVPITNHLDCDLLPIDSAITIISIFSYSLKRYQDEITTLAQHMNLQFLTNQSPINRAKLYILMGYCFDDFYSQNMAQGSFWIHAALSDNSHPTLIKACLDFMNNVADDYYDNPFLEALIDRIPSNKEGGLWSTLVKMINSQYNKIGQPLMLRLVSTIFLRLEKEVKILETNETNLTVTIINLIQLLCTIVDLPDYTYDKPQLKVEIWKITNMIDFSIRYSFEDQIMLIVLSFVNQSNEIIKQFMQVFPKVLEIFKRDTYTSKTCLKLINEFIVKDKSRQSLPAILKVLNTAMMTYLMELSQKAKKRQIKPVLMGNLLVLLQNFIFFHKDILGDNQIYEISSLALRFIPEKKEEIIDKVLLARALNILLLCHMLRPTDFIWRTISTFYREEVFFSYDVCVLQTIVEIEVFREAEYQMKGIILGILAHVIHLYKKRKEKQKNAKKIRQKYGKQKSKIKINRYAEYEVEVKKMTTPFNTNNSQKRFVQIMKKMRQEYYTIFPQLFNQVSEQDQKAIMDLENVTNIASGKQRIIYQVKGMKQNTECLNEMDIVEKRQMEQNDSDEEIGKKRDRNVLKLEKKKKKKNQQQMKE